VRAWRRFYFTSGGLAFTFGTLAVGFAAMNTGNNLLYLLLGSMIGFIVVSSWLSEQAIRDVSVERHRPHPVTVGHEFRLTYTVTNRKRLLPSLAVEIVEEGLPGRAFVAHVAPGATVETRSTNSFVRRGIYPLETVTLSTSFPFGMFRKERDIDLPGEVTVWPRTDRRVRQPRGGAGRPAMSGATRPGGRGTRGEYRSLRGYRAGDDPKDIHWKSSARLREPVIREYELDGAETRWICLDTRSHADEAAEVAVEVAAALAARAAAEHRPFAFISAESVLEPGDGPAQLERTLDILARIDFDPADPAPDPPVAREACLLVSVHPRSGFGDLFAVGPGAQLGWPEGAAEPDAQVA
jgi:uncharacterized protein (DUF58 family)